MDTKSLNALPKTKGQFIEPMYARLVQNLPQGREWLYEVKFDGYRCLAGREANGVTLWSRLFTKQFPHIANACERLPLGTLIDGEIVAVDENGRVSFNLLQHHRSKAQALLFYVFDLLVSWNQSSFKKMQPMAAAEVALKSPLIPLFSKGELLNCGFNPSWEKGGRGDFDPTLRKLFNEF